MGWDFVLNHENISESSFIPVDYEWLFVIIVRDRFSSNGTHGLAQTQTNSRYSFYNAGHFRLLKSVTKKVIQKIKDI